MRSKSRLRQGLPGDRRAITGKPSLLWLRARQT